MTYPPTVARQDLTCYRGKTYRQDLFCKTDGQIYPLRGFSFCAEIRPAENSRTLTAEFDVTTDADAGCITARVGWASHCNNFHFLERYIKPYVNLAKTRRIISHVAKNKQRRSCEARGGVD